MAALAVEAPHRGQGSSNGRLGAADGELMECSNRESEAPIEAFWPGTQLLAGRTQSIFVSDEDRGDRHQAIFEVYAWPYARPV